MMATPSDAIGDAGDGELRRRQRQENQVRAIARCAEITEPGLFGNRSLRPWSSAGIAEVSCYLAMGKAFFAPSARVVGELDGLRVRGGSYSSCSFFRDGTACSAIASNVRSRLLGADYRCRGPDAASLRHSAK
jgi:hypothetical protein